LPKDVPTLRGLDIAAFMKTATEVGGDYYDFFVSDDGVLTAVLGDATGHGLKAGHLVIATKGLLSMLSGTERIEDILNSANQAIKRMDLHMLTMCLAIVRVAGRSVSYASAGMPPLLVYRASSGTCDQCIVKAMPLGAVAGFPYASTSVLLHTGDILAMVSDGLLEVFDENREVYGIENVMASLQKHAPLPAGEIVKALFEDGMDWGGDAPLADDLAIIVMKVSGDGLPGPALRS